ncbi:phosphotransferase [Paraburkholderia sp. D15]|uniref:phosphotransferase enzyme family protein n=1 Tax=Paraburkholderia sp. D15 TaxID=2880218 RepID=UPI002479C2EC|nr:phosphotransferase [Paraburkholderia sp. D15]WGS51693.1 phosphotransferase [Paraburkholderia sp. D15]
MNTEKRTTSIDGQGIDEASAVAREPVAPKQFGVGGVEEERDWPLMTHEEVGAVLAGFRHRGRADYPARRDPPDHGAENGTPLGPIASLCWHSPRQFASGALVDTANGDTLFVKRHHVSIRDVEGLHEEHRFIAHLQSRGVPVTDVLCTLTGATALRVDDWTYEVHALAAGVDLYRDSHSWSPFSHASHAYAAGRALARLHRASADYMAPERTIRPLMQSFRVIGAARLDDALDAWIGAQPLLAQALATRPWRADIAACIAPFHAALAPLLPALEPLWTHGDWHASNLLWSADAPDAQVRTVLDFGLSDRTCAVYDLALAIERNTIEWLSFGEGGTHPVYTDQIDALLNGYESLSPLSDVAYAALCALLPIVHTEFALSELAYFDGILHAPADGEVAYTTYLLDHARWFAAGQGRTLLAWMRTRRRVDPHTAGSAEV